MNNLRESAPLLGAESDASKGRKNRKNRKRRGKQRSQILPTGNDRDQQVARDTVNTSGVKWSDVSAVSPLMKPQSSETDFDQIDSWGMLHESDAGDWDPTFQDTGSAFKDHRPSYSAPATRHAVPSVSNSSNASSFQPRFLLPHASTSELSKPKQPKKLKTDSTTKGTRNTRKGLNDHPHVRRNTFDYGTSPHINDLRERIANRENNNDVVIDVDALMKHVHKNRRSISSGSRTSSNSSSSRISTLKNHDDANEVSSYNSRPSSRGSSSNSSLDDVCLFIPEEFGSIEKVWPDVKVLEEFSKEETERLRRQAARDAEDFRSRYDNEDEDDEYDGFSMDQQQRSQYGSMPSSDGKLVPTNEGNGILFSRPLVTNIDVPELGNRRVNEAEQMKPGRLRPKRLAPWHLRQRSAISHIPETNSGEPTGDEMRDNLLVGRNILYPPHIISNNPEHFRFTYFRVDLDDTVHSPTISGLLQPGQKFQDLFVAPVYTQNTISDYDGNFGDNTGGQSNDLSRHPSNGIHNTQSNTLLANVGNNIASNTMSSIHTDSVGGNGALKGLTPNHTGGYLMKNNSTLSGTQSSNIDNVTPFWLDVINPTEEEMKVLSKAFGIHPLTTEDIFLGEIREKVELFKDYYLICFRSFDIVAERVIRKKMKSKHSVHENGDSDHETGSSSFITKKNRRRSTAGGPDHGNSGPTTSGHDYNTANGGGSGGATKSWLSSVFKRRRRRSSDATRSVQASSRSSLRRSKKKELENYKRKSGDRHKPREGELEPLNVYIIVFRTGVLTFHFAPTPHPINVRRRARLLKDYLNVTADWIAYALIDDITDAFGPMIELIEDEVYEIEDSILSMHHGDSSSSEDDSESDSGSDSSSSRESGLGGALDKFSFKSRRPRSRSIAQASCRSRLSSAGSLRSSRLSSRLSSSSSSSRSSASYSSSFDANLIGWKRKGDMLRRIGECRKRVMSLLRLLGSKADVIKGFAKRYNELGPSTNEIGMYLGDIQDHIVTMVSSLNHYEKLLSRSHSNYLAQINIDMTKVNNDMNDVLGKITILGTIVLPMNVITGLWGMNVLVPGQDRKNLAWFFSIVLFMLVLAWTAYVYTSRKFQI